MSDPNTLRILSLDGGGERGYMSLQFLKNFINLWGIDPATLAQKFDVICGTSIGGIMGLAFAFGLTPDEILPFFTVQGPYIFSLTSLTPSVRPTLAAKIVAVLANVPFYQSSGPTAALYGSGLLAATLTSTFGTSTMQDLQTSVLIPSYQKDTSTYVLFSDLNYPDFIGQNELISNVALATSAAPLYLPVASFGGHQYLDGGVYQNDPARLGRSLAMMTKPTASRCCVLSLGTGIGEMGFDPDGPGGLEVGDATDAIKTLFSLFDIAQTGGQESVAKALYLESQYTLNQFYYYRFQPDLNQALDTELDNTDPAILTYYIDTANTVFANDISNITAFLGHLTA